MSSSAPASISKQQQFQANKMAASKNVVPEAKASKMHRRSRSGTSVSGVHGSLSFDESDSFQDALHVDCGERSVKRESLPVKRAST